MLEHVLFVFSTTSNIEFRLRPFMALNRPVTFQMVDACCHNT